MNNEQSRFLALMSDYDRTLELVDIAQNSNGASAAQFAKTLTSVDAKLKKVSSTFEGFINATVSSDFVKDILDGLNNIMKTVNNITKKGPVYAITLGAAFIATAKNIVNSFLQSGRIIASAWNGTFGNTFKDIKAEGQKQGQNLVVEIEKALQSSQISTIIRDKIAKGITEGVHNGVKEGQTAAQSSTPTTKNTSNIVTNTLSKKNVRQIQKTLQSGGILSTSDYKKLKQAGYTDFSNEEILNKLDQDFGSLSQQSSLLKQSFAQLGAGALNTVASLLMMQAAAKGSAATEGAVVGSSAGNLVGSGIGAAIGTAIAPGLGTMIGSSLGSALGNVLGTGLGSYIGEEINKATYGIGSESSIKKLEEIASKVGEEASNLEETNNEIIENAEEYVSLAEKVNLTNEEKEKLVELNGELNRLMPDLISNLSGENSVTQVQIQQLKEQIKLRKKENALAEIRSEIASGSKEYAEKIKTNIDDETNNYIQQRQNLLDSVRKLDFNFKGQQTSEEKQQQIIYNNDDPVNQALSNVSFLTATGGTLLSSSGQEVKQEESEVKNLIPDFTKNLAAIIQESGLQLEEISSKELSANIDNILQSVKDRIASPETLKELKGSLNQLVSDLADIEEREGLNEIVKGLDDTIQDSLDYLFSDVSTDSFAAKNKQFLADLFSYQFSTQELKSFYMKQDVTGEWVAKTEEEQEAAAKELLERRIALGEEVIAETNALTKKDQEAFQNAFSMVGLFTDESGSVDTEAVLKYLDSLGNTISPAVEDLIKKVTDNKQYVQNQKQTYASLREEDQKYVNSLKDRGKQIEALSFGKIASQFDQEDIVWAKAFQEAFNEVVIQSGEDSKTIQKYIKAIGETDITSANAIAKLSSSLKALGMEEKDILTLTSSMGSVFDRTGLTSVDALTDINTQLESVSDWVEIIEKDLSGSMTLNQLDSLNNMLEKVGKNQIDLSQIVATGDGLGLKGSSASVIQLGLDTLKDYAQGMIHQASQSAAYNQSKAAFLEQEKLLEKNKERVEEIQQEIDSLNTEAADQQKVANYYSIMYAQSVAQAEQAKIDKQEEQIENYKEMIAQLNRFYNLERQSIRIANDASLLESSLDLVKSSDEAAKVLSKQTLNLVEEQELLKASSKAYKKEMSSFASYINKTYGEYLQVGKDGNISQNNSALIKLANKMKKATGSEADELSNLYNAIEEVRSAYETMYDSAAETAQQQKENLKKQKELEQQKLQYQIAVEQKLRDIIIDNMKKEVEEVKKKYQKIKEEDQKYLNALQKNLNKRKQAQQDTQSDEEIETLQRRISLLSMDTSGIYAKEVEDLQEELNQKLLDRNNTALDRMYEAEQERVDNYATELDEKSNLLQEELDKEQETYEKSNAQVAELMKKTSKEILNFMLTNSAEYAKMNLNEQQNFRTEWQNSINLAKGAQSSLTSHLEEQKQAIIGKFDSIRTNGIDKYEAAIDEANEKKITVQVDTAQLVAAEKRIQSLEDNYKDFLKTQATSELLDLANEYKKETIKSGSKSAASKSLEAQANQQLKYVQSLGVDGEDYEQALQIIKEGQSQTGTKKQTQDSSLLGEYTINKSGLSSKTGIYAYTEKGSLASRTAIYPRSDVKVLKAKKIDGEIYLQAGATEKDGYFRGYTQAARGGMSNGVSTFYKPWFKQSDFKKMYKKYAKGGLVDYTGPAWVDGTNSRPEAFLSASDTQNIASLRDILSKVFSKTQTGSTGSSVENDGDTYYEFHINIDKLDEGYDAEQMMKDMEKYIVQKANYRKVTNIKRR